MKLAKSSIAIALTVALQSYSNHALANDAVDSENLNNTDIEVLTVTSDFRDSNLQDIPSSLSILTEQEITRRNAQNLEEMVASAPNVNFSSGTQRARYYQIRGIGERSQFQEPINPSVGLIIDDIDFTGVGSIASMFDVAQTEIFRGPQGTRFGANALAGIINITTKAPTDAFEGRLKALVGNYGSIGIGGAISGPATDSVNYRVAVEQYQSDGFIDNVHLGEDDTNNRDELTARAKFNVTLSAEHQLDIAAYYFDFDNGYDAFSLDNTRETLSDQPGFDKQETTAFSIKSTYAGFESAELITIATYADSDMAYGYDEDWSFVGLHPWEYSSTDHYLRDKSSATLDARLLSNESSRLFNQSTSWVVGVYAKSEEEDLTRQYTYLSSDFSSTFDTDTFAVYGQLETELSTKLSLTTGLRIENRSADYRNSDGTSFDPSDTMVGGKAVLSYQLTDGAMVYGSVNRGYKAGGVNTDGTLPVELREFDPEYLWNYEVGYKLSLMDGDAYVRVAAFYMDREDVQVKSSKTITRADGSSEFIVYLGNAAEGTNQGLEIDAAWQINDSLEVYGALGILDTEIDNYINQEGVDISGRDQAHAPGYQANLGVNFYLNDAWFINVGVDAKDEFYFSDSHDEQSDAIELVNASINYQLANWQVSLWGRNITDKDYATRGFYFGNDPRDGYEAKPYVQYGEPGVYGITVNYEF